MRMISPTMSTSFRICFLRFCRFAGSDFEVELGAILIHIYNIIILFLGIGQIGWGLDMAGWVYSGTSVYLLSNGSFGLHWTN
jgi:hypothetical protein